MMYNVSLSEAAEVDIRKSASALDSFYDRIMGCRVIVEAPHRRPHQGLLYHIAIEPGVPGKELVVDREP